jgi:ATP-dependent helicase/nuclease subunit A
VSAAFIPIDEEQRRRIRTRIDENMCVEAGAGTGKTSVLVDRIVHLLSTTDADVRRMAVITFTEKAAAELASRVRRGLEDAREAATAIAEVTRLDDALRGLNAAHIETIHAFAASILRERPVEADLDPGFQVLDVLPAQLEFEHQYSEWLAAEMAAEPPPEALVEALNLGLDPKHVREAAERLHAHRDMLPLAEYEPVEVDVGEVMRNLAPQMEILESKHDCCFVQEDQAYQELLRMLDWYADTRTLTHIPSLRRSITMVNALRFGRGNQKNWRQKDDCRQAKAALTAIDEIIDGARGVMRGNAVAGMVLWLQEFVRTYEQHRREQGKADFDDLLIWARDLIRDDKNVRAYFQSKFERLFVDEFQDTDPLQAELIVSLCAREPLPDDWQTTTLRPGSLFVVGDPKQSIYRFRRADIAMYDGVKRNVFRDEPVRIVQNFRSTKPIIDWVNARFDQLFNEQIGVQPPYVELAERPDVACDAPVSVLRGIAPPGEDGKLRADDIRRFEAEKLASLIHANVTNEQWQARQRDGTWAPARYRDVVVLIPSRTSLEIYEDAFARADVPYRHEGGRTFFVRQEVRELVAVLRAIDDPGDAVAAVAALRSSAFGCSDEDLLLHRHAGGRFDHAAVRADAAGPVAEALRVLHELADLRYAVTLPEMIRAVLDRTRLVEFAMLQPQGEQVAANLLKMIDQARTFAEASGRGLRGFVRWLKDNIARQTDETDAPISEETDDVVRIVTIHASKGLEFPIVVLANMAADRRDYTTVLADRVAHRLHVKLGAKDNGFRTPGYDHAEADELPHTLAEERRLLYVAATRAKDRLIVSLIDNSDNDAPPRQVKSLNDVLRTSGAHLGDCIDLDALETPQGDPPIWRRPIETPSADDIARVASEREAWIAAHEALTDFGGARMLIHTASSLKPEMDTASSFADGVVRRGRATDFGTAVHAVLERSLLRDEGVEALAEATAREYGMADRAGEMAAVARRALASDLVRRARPSRRILLETPFTAPLDNMPAGLAEGRIDLLFEEDGELVIVDFKTDAVSANDFEARAAFYRNQALVYAWAARSATRMRVREVVFLFARPDPAIEHHTPVDDAFMAEAEALLRGEPTLA